MFNRRELESPALRRWQWPTRTGVQVPQRSCDDPSFCRALAAVLEGPTERLGPLRFVPARRARRRPDPRHGHRAARPGARLRRRPDLVTTLRAFVAADGNVAATGEACFTHKNPLRYRLKRLADVLGRAPAAPEAKFHLRMAFDLVELFAGIGIG